MLQIKRMALLLGIGICTATALKAQSDYIPLGNKQYQLLERLDIKLRNDSVLAFTTMKMYNRRSITERVQLLDSFDRAGILATPLTPLDRYNIGRLLSANNEWTRNPAAYQTKKGLFSTFYRNQANMYEVHTSDFHMTVNPVLDLKTGSANDGTGSIFRNTRGLHIRGNVDKRIGFYTYLTDNQERLPLFVRQYGNKYSNVPGAGFFKLDDKDNRIYDYFDARGGISFRAGRHVDILFAYDNLELGNGIRSLFLSSTSAPYLFLKVKTRVWKFDYENVFAEMTRTYRRGGGDNLLPKKYMAAHHLSFQAAKWLNLGLFENVVFGRENGFELQYLNPVIFYRSAEQQMGSPDKATVGIDLKSNVNRHLQLYGQLVINEFVAAEIARYREGDWRNKHAAQIGLKYIDVAGVNNLDLQLEYNWIRPFTYTHRDSTTSFTHYNQPLAHPLGASIREFIAQVRYQPLKKLYINAELMAYRQGTDRSGQNYGSNIFLDYDTRTVSRGVFVGDRNPGDCRMADVHVAYELLDNIFAEASFTNRSYKLTNAAAGTSTRSDVTFYSIGLRANIARRHLRL